MAQKAAKHSRTSTARPKRATAKPKPRPRRISAAGIDEVATVDLDSGSEDAVDIAETARPMSPQGAKEIALAAGDLDATFSGLDSGEETPSGSDPLPDQEDVDRIGTALGVVEQDEKPLATTEKIEGRDRERWELDPASSEDYEERQRAEPARPHRRRRR